MSSALFGGSKSFFRSVKRGGKISVAKQVKKIYLRSDLPCGSEACPTCKPLMDDSIDRAWLEVDAEHYLIPDTNIFLHNIDVLESPLIRNVVVMDTVLEEIKGLNKSVHERVAKLITDPDKKKRFYAFSNEHHRDTVVPDQEAGESANDRNDKAIRIAAKWYQIHLSTVTGAPKIILLTHDKANREKAEEMGIEVMGMSEYVHAHFKNETALLDKVAHSVPAKSERWVPGTMLYRPHLDVHEAEMRIKEGKLVKGNLRQTVTSLGWVSVADSSSKGGFKEILIPNRTAVNRCIDGDTVAVQLLPVAEWTKPKYKLSAESEVAGVSDEEEARKKGFYPTGEIVALLAHKRRPICGSIVWDGDEENRSAGLERVLMQPIKSNFPRIRLQTRQAEQLKGKRIQAVIDEWTVYSAYPDGHYVKVLGDVGDKDVEAEVILLENDVPHYEFPQKVLDCLPKGEWKVEDEEVAVRRDFRSDCDVVSVDPPGCKDIDDALHCKELPNGNFEVGVHIADVTHFMKEGTALDEEAQKRSTSVYLVDRRIDMLPKILTENLCSLVGGEERYTFSVVWEVTPECEVVNVEFTKGIIRSRGALSYYKAQEMVDNPDDNSPIAKSLKNLLRLSRILKQRRIDAGALTLASQEMKFTMDVEGQNNPTDVMEYEHIPTMSMIEEFMLFANVEVAKKIHQEFPKWACLRRHPAPADGSLDQLNEALALQKMPHLSGKSSKALADTLDDCNDANDPYFNKLVRILTTRTMQQAKYFSSGEFPYEEYWHYGLAMPIYTHFTSPIRRFADVVVHRQLSAAIGIAKRSEAHMDAMLMKEITTNMNYRHTLAQHAGRDSRNLYIGFVFDNYKDGREIPEEEGYVVRVRDNGVDVLVPRYGTEGTVFYEDEGQQVWAGKLHQLDKVRVKITLRAGAQGDAARNKLLYRILEKINVDRVLKKVEAGARISMKRKSSQTKSAPSAPSPSSPPPPKKTVKKIIRKKVVKKRPEREEGESALPTAKHQKAEDDDDDSGVEL